MGALALEVKDNELKIHALELDDWVSASMDTESDELRNRYNKFNAFLRQDSIR